MDFIQGLDEEGRKSLIEYTVRLDCKMFGVSEEETERILLLDTNERYNIMHNLRQEHHKRLAREKENARRRERRAERKEIKELRARYLENQLIEEEKKRLKIEKVRASKKKYKEENCLSVQVFLERELVEEFRWKTRTYQDSQAEIIRECIKNYIATHKLGDSDGEEFTYERYKERYKSSKTNNGKEDI